MEQIGVCVLLGILNAVVVLTIIVKYHSKIEVKSKATDDVDGI